MNYLSYYRWSEVIRELREKEKGEKKRETWRGKRGVGLGCRVGSKLRLSVELSAISTSEGTLACHATFVL